jgi:uncharacterized protein
LRSIPLACAALALAACGERAPDPRGVDHDETLLSVGATGEAEAIPDMAYIEVGVNSYAAGAQAASRANNAKIAKVVEALGALGVADKDTQTRMLSIQKLDYGPNKGQYQASNVLEIRLRKIDRASEAVAAATEAGANILSGPSLRIADPETANRGAYAAAYRAAKARAEAYAGAAEMEIARVLTIRDGGASQSPGPVGIESDSRGYAPPPVAQAVAPPPAIRAGSTLTRVGVQVDFALREK